jgi:hypothetical protein
MNSFFCKRVHRISHNPTKVAITGTKIRKQVHVFIFSVIATEQVSFLTYFSVICFREITLFTFTILMI